MRAAGGCSPSFDLILRDLMMARASFPQLSDEDGVLLFNRTSIASDGWSMGVLVKEFVAQYEALRSGGDRSCGAVDPLCRLRPVATGVAQRCGAGRTAELLATAASAVARRAQPAAGPGASGATALQGARHTFAIDKATYEGLRQVAQAKQATLFMVLHAGLSVLLARHSHSSSDIRDRHAGGQPAAEELEEIIGLFVNTLVLRTDVSGDPRFDGVPGAGEDGEPGGAEPSGCNGSSHWWSDSNRSAARSAQSAVPDHVSLTNSHVEQDAPPRY